MISARDLIRVLHFPLQEVSDWISLPYSPECVEGEFSEVREDHLFRVCAPAHLGTIIWLLLSRAPSEIPLPRAARLFSCLPLLTEPHPTPRFYQRRLCRGVCGFEPVSQDLVLRVGEPMGSVCLQCRELPYQRR